jgi:hypothetical protein
MGMVSPTAWSGDVISSPDREVLDTLCSGQRTALIWQTRLLPTSFTLYLGIEASDFQSTQTPPRLYTVQVSMR